jgi:hypothetical protein
MVEVEGWPFAAAPPDVRKASAFPSVGHYSIFGEAAPRHLLRR